MPTENRKGVGNAHAHHLIGDYIPGKIFKQQLKDFSKLLQNKNFVKYVIGCPVIRPLIWLIFGKQECKFLILMRTDKISKARKIHISEMEKAGIDYSVVFTLDYLYAAKLTPEECLPSSRKPILATFTPQEILAFYETQLEETAQSLAQEPFRFFLFHCFDPRRENARQLLEKAYHSLGIVGIKLYPALGFHPVPGKNEKYYCANEFLLNPGQTEKQRLEMLEENLEAMYTFAGEKGLPIISHCGSGGSFTTLLDDNQLEKKVLWEFTQPGNFPALAEKYNIRICLAHAGGKIHLVNEDEPEIQEKAREWRETIIKAINDNNKGSGSTGKMYTDLSFDLSRVLEDDKNLPVYINDARKYLEDPHLNKYVLVGSDWPMGLHAFPEKNYIRPYREQLSPEEQEPFFQDNIARYLFGETKQIPANYIRFLESQRKGKALKLPPWVRREGEDYFLV